MDAVMLGNTAIVTAKHSASDVLCHRMRQSSSLTGATLQVPLKCAGLPQANMCHLHEIDGSDNAGCRVRGTAGRCTFVELQNWQQPGSHYWSFSARQLRLAWQPLGAEAHHRLQLPVQPPFIQDLF